MRIDNSFNWFTGVVEDRNDPEKLNRVRVRVFGAHTNKKQDLATADLPWATVMMPTTSSSNSGLGLTLHGLVEGSWVVGFWKDGNSQQDPMIIGSFVGVANENIKKKSVAEWNNYNSFSKFAQEDFIGPLSPQAVAVGEIVKKGPITQLGPTDVRIEGNPVHGTKYDLSPVETSGKGSGLKIEIYTKENTVSPYNDPPSWWVGEFWAEHPDIDNPYNTTSRIRLIDDGKDYEVGDTVFFEYDAVEKVLLNPLYSTTSDKEIKFSFTMTVSSIYGDELVEGFLDPRLTTLGQYDKTPEGPNPQHNPSRTTGLTLTLADSPRGHDLKDEIMPSTYPRVAYKNESDVNKLGRADGKYDKTIWPNSMIEDGGIGKTLFSGDWGYKSDNEDRASWVKPKYPFNHVYESESGHVIEIDDTPGYERINLFHRKGARIEINNEGEIHILAAPGQDLNLQGKDVNINDMGLGTLNIKSAGLINILAAKATKITSKGPTSIISTGVTKLFSMLDTKIASIGKNIIG